MADPPFEPGWQTSEAEAVFNIWYQSLRANRLPTLPGQPSNSVSQELDMSVGRSGVSMQTLDDLVVTPAGGSNYVNFEAPRRLMQPQSTSPDSVLRMSQPQGHIPVMMSRQPVVFETSPPSSFRYPSNPNFQQFRPPLLLEPQAPMPGTSQIAFEAPLPSQFSNLQHLDFQHAGSAALSQSQVPMSTRHVVSEAQPLSSLPDPNPGSNFNDQRIASSSRAVSLAVFPELNRIRSQHTGSSLQWTAPLGTSPFNIEAPPRLPPSHELNFRNFEPLPRVSSPSFTLPQELSVQDTGSDGPLAGSSGRRTMDIQSHRFSPLPNRRNANLTAIEDTITEKLGRSRGVNAS